MPTFVQTASNSTGASTSLTVTLGAAPQAGNLLVCWVYGNIVVSGITGGGVTWVLGTPSASGANDIWYGPNSSGSGTSIAISPASGSNGVLAIVAEFSGILTASPVDIANASATNTSAGSVITGASLTTTAANDLICILAACYHATNTPTIGTSNTAGWTDFGNVAQTASGVNLNLLGSYRTGAIGTYTDSWNTAQSFSSSAKSAAIAFLAAPPPPPTIGLPSSMTVPIISVQSW